MIQKRRTLFIDSALPEEIEKALARGFQGVTTNPSLVAKAPKGDASKGFMERYLVCMHSIIGVCKKYLLKDGSLPSLSVEVFSLDPEEMIRQASFIRDQLNYPNLAIKIPISYKGKDYIEVIRKLASDEFKINATCGFSAGQLDLAAQAGARFISLFYNRLIDYCNALPNSNGNGQLRAIEELKRTRVFLDNNSLDCEIILGSIRSHFDVTVGWEQGADIVTAGFKVIPGLLDHPATDISVEGFDKDLKEWFK